MNVIVTAIVVGVLLLGLLAWAISRNAIVRYEREERRFQRWKNRHK